ncbi:hypothetical protein P8452_48382 [Trifolium repens]|nr:hypothetical protein P8452_48382 [Trifolium repens]
MIPVKRIRRNLSSSSYNDNLKKLKKKKTRRNHSPSTSRTTVSNQQESVRHVDECLKGNNSLDCNTVSNNCILPSEDANVRVEYTSTTHDETSEILERVQSDCYREETSHKCVGNDKGENLKPKRKSTVMDKCSDVTDTSVNDDYRNLIERPRCNVVDTNRSSKRIRRTSNVDQPTYFKIYR